MESMSEIKERYFKVQQEEKKKHFLEEGGNLEDFKPAEDPAEQEMKDLLHKHSHWKYFINLTGEEFPLKTNLELVRILSVYGGANDVWGFSPELVNLHLFRII